MILNPLHQRHRLPDVNGGIAGDEPVAIAAVEDVVVLGEPVGYSIVPEFEVMSVMDYQIRFTRRVEGVWNSWGIATYIA
jgi:hypothetical protein